MGDRDLVAVSDQCQARSESRACEIARSETPREWANPSPSASHAAPHVDAFVSRAALIEKLRRDTFETAAGYTELELASRRGWNDRARDLLRWLGVSDGIGGAG